LNEIIDHFLLICGGEGRGGGSWVAHRFSFKEMEKGREKDREKDGQNAREILLLLLLINDEDKRYLLMNVSNVSIFLESIEEQ